MTFGMKEPRATVGFRSLSRARARFRRYDPSVLKSQSSQVQVSRVSDMVEAGHMKVRRTKVTVRHTLRVSHSEPGLLHSRAKHTSMLVR